MINNVNDILKNSNLSSPETIQERISFLEEEKKHAGFFRVLEINSEISKLKKELIGYDFRLH